MNLSKKTLERQTAEKVKTVKDKLSKKKFFSNKVKESVPVPSEPITCLNCGYVHQERYCPQCGQRSNIKRFNWAGVFENMTKGILNTDRGFLFTIKELFIRPGKVIKDYLEGARVKYFPPFPMMFIVAGFYALVKKVGDLAEKPIEVDKAAIEELSKSITEETGKNVDTTITKFQDFVEVINDLLTNNFGLMMLLATPIIVTCIRWCFGKYFRKNYNWAESFIMSGYLNAQIFIILLFFAVVTMIFPHFDSTNLFAVFCFVGIVAWDMYPLSKLTKKRSAVGRSILSYLLFFTILILVIIILVIAGIAIYLAITGEKGLTLNL